MARATVIKICGLTTGKDAQFALQAGADWIGLNFVAGPRQITLSVAKDILAQIEDPTRAVALILVDETDGYEKEAETFDGLGIQCLQLYGHVTPEVVARLAARGFQTIVARTVPDVLSLQVAERFLKDCADVPPSFLLLDAASQHCLGGTGRLANWPAIAEATRENLFVDWPPVILAGGLDADNVGAAIHELSPNGVDVCSGVESSPGHKDHAKVVSFIEAARRAL